MNIAPEIWEQVEKAHPTGDELIARVARPELTTRLLVATDARGHRHLLVRIDPTAMEVSDGQSRGLTVTTRLMRLPEHQESQYIDLLCEDALGHAMLDVVGSELIDRLHAGSEDPSSIVTRVLGKWRRFWGQLPTQALTREAQLGLFAELWFLAYWLVPAVGPGESVRRWRGPHGARHDFEQPGRSVEAKATTSTRGRLFRINGVTQLEPPENGRLLFFGMRLREEAGASNSLPAVVEACRQCLASDPDAVGAMETSVIVAGYAARHEEEYVKLRLRVVEERLFDVRDDFPRVVSTSFPEGVPPGVEDLGYVINLDALNHLCVAQQPSDAREILS